MISKNDIAFEVSIDIEPVDEVDLMQFTIIDGEYNEETGWVSGRKLINSNNLSKFVIDYI